MLNFAIVFLTISLSVCFGYMLGAWVKHSKVEELERYVLYLEQKNAYLKERLQRF